MINIDLKDRVSIVTGASRGIGFAIADRLAAAGSNLVINAYSNEELLQERCAYLSETYGVEVIGVLGDVGKADDCSKIVKAAFSNFRRLDVLVNNAGVLKDGFIGMIANDDVDATLNTNLKSVIYLTQNAARLMQRGGGGSIVNISSIIGRFGNEGQLVYGASKAGVIGATLSGAKELAPKNIRVNAIAPGYIETDMIKAIPADIHEQRMASIKMGVVGQPEDIAKAALFLASDLSTYVTGQVIGVDGGMLV